MEKVVVRPTWQLAWGLCWRFWIITLGIYVVIFGILFAVVGPALFGILGSMPY